VEAYVKIEKVKSAKESYSRMLKIFEQELSEKPDDIILKKINNLLQTR
jgi:hypothetical protein